MKTNSFTELLLNFDKMSNSLKLQRMQDLENMTARFQGRKPRIVTNKVPKNCLKFLKQGSREPVAFYNRGDPTKIYIIQLDSGIDAAKDIIHEGFHAYVDDFLRGKVVLRTFSDVDSERFLFEQKNMPKILNYLMSHNMMQLYDSYFVEERLNYKENTLYLLKYIFDCIENIEDKEKMSTFVVEAFLYYCENEYRGNERELRLKTKYDDVIQEAIKSSSEKEIDISKTKKITDKIDLDLLNFFNNIYPYISECRKIKSNMMISPEERNKIVANNMIRFDAIYKEYANNLLKKKMFGE